MSAIEFKSNICNGYAALSNFWPYVTYDAHQSAVQRHPSLADHDGSFYIDSVRYKSVEHWFQAQKYRDQPDVFTKIVALPTALNALRENQRQRRLGNIIDIRSWDAKRDAVMMQGLRAKFSQSVELTEFLLSTVNQHLQEQGNDYWCGPYGRLGQLLMQLRDELIEECVPE